MTTDLADRRRWLAVVTLLLVCSAVALTSRSDAGLFLAIASLGAWISAEGYRRTVRVRSLLLLAFVVAGVTALVAGAGQSQRWAGELGAQEGNSLAAVWFESALDIPRRVLGALGAGELGWLDTPLPALVSVPMLLAFGAVVVIGLGVASRAKWLAFAVVAGATAGIPLIVLTSGQNVQPRYVLPLLPVVASTALISARGGLHVELRRGQALLVVGAVIVAHAVALHTNIRRYVTGLDEGGPDLGASVEWWWSVGPGQR